MAGKKSSASKIKMERFDDLFGSGSDTQDSSDRVMMIPLEQLHDFSGHPFKVLDDEKMEETVESIRQYGVLNPALARPRPDGEYELLSGHRRNDIVNITLHFFLKDVRPMQLFVTNHNIVDVSPLGAGHHLQNKSFCYSNN